MKRKGLLAGGNWIVDHIKLIDCWPPEETLASILEESRSSGGSPFNILKDLSALGAPFPLEGVGLVGDDELGRWARADCRAHGIVTRQLRATAKLPTSYTDVMSVKSTGKRTFFHQRGANALLAPEHFDFSQTRAKIFHLGYLLLLDTLDSLNAAGKPRACEVLAAARAAGLLTSIDVVSEASDRFRQLVPATLPYVDYLFVNDYEASRITGIALNRDDRIRPAAVEKAAEALIGAGVRRTVVIHFPEAVYARNRTGATHWQPSLQMPKDRIKGAAGAGDALAAGVLFGLHEGWPMKRSLLLGVAAAASSLTHPSCSAGIVTADQCFALAREVGLRQLPR